MKKWSKPEVSNLCVQLTNEFEIEPLKSEASCNKTPEAAENNKGIGCSERDKCKYYESNSNGKGGKCGGVKVYIS